MIEKGANDFNEGLVGACCMRNLEAINLMIEKGVINFDMAVETAYYNDHLDIMKLMRQLIWPRI